MIDGFTTVINQCQERRADGMSVGFRKNLSDAAKTTGPNPNLRKVVLTTKDILGSVILTRTHFGLRSAVRLYY